MFIISEITHCYIHVKEICFTHLEHFGTLKFPKCSQPPDKDMSFFTVIQSIICVAYDRICKKFHK